VSELRDYLKNEEQSLRISSKGAALSPWQHALALIALSWSAPLAEWASVRVQIY